MKPLDLMLDKPGRPGESIEKRMNDLMAYGPTGLSMIGHLLNYSHSDFHENGLADAHFQHVTDPSVGFMLPYRRAFLPTLIAHFDNYKICVAVTDNMLCSEKKAAVLNHAIDVLMIPHLEDVLAEVILDGDEARIVAAEHHPIFYGALTLRLVPPGSLPLLLRERRYPNIFKMKNPPHTFQRQRP